MTDTLIVDTLAPPTLLPYGFARKGGVLVRGGECLHRTDAALDALLEVQRLHPAVAFAAVSDEAFDAALSATYGQGAAQAAEALDADGVVVVNRVKPHTDFESTRIGSGLLKMLAIGFGKSEGAAACHRGAQRHGLERVLLDVGQAALTRLPVIAGLALIEDGKHALARVEALAKPAIVDREPALVAGGDRVR